MEKLEKRAVETTLEDIGTYRPELYKELKSRNVASVAALNTIAVKKQFEAAPRMERSRKPAWSNIPNLDDAVYKEYFKID